MEVEREWRWREGEGAREGERWRGSKGRREREGAREEGREEGEGKRKGGRMREREWVMKTKNYSIGASLVNMIFMTSFPPFIRNPPAVHVSIIYT